MKRYCVDSLAMVVFFTLIATVSEVFVARMSMEQVLMSRGAAIPAMLITARPYGIWRDAWFRRGAAHRRGVLARTVLDIGAFLTFQVPVYAAILLLTGVSGEQILVALSGAVVLMVLTSRPFGMFLDLCRTLARTQPPSPQ